MLWCDRYKLLFGRPLSAEDVQNWHTLLDEDFTGNHGWTADEVHTALSALAEYARQAGRKADPPTYPALKSALIRARYEAKKARVDGDPPRDCELCHDGLLDLYEYQGTYPRHPTADQARYGTVQAVPCLCDAGRRLLDMWSKTRPDLRDVRVRAARHAIEQARALAGVVMADGCAQ